LRAEEEVVDTDEEEVDKVRGRGQNGYSCACGTTGIEEK